MTLCTWIITNSAFSRFVSGYPRAIILFRTSYFSRSSVERLFSWAHVDDNIVRLLVSILGYERGRVVRSKDRRNTSKRTANICRTREVLSTAHLLCPSYTRQCSQVYEMRSILTLVSNVFLRCIATNCQQPSSNGVSLILKERRPQMNLQMSNGLAPTLGGFFRGTYDQEERLMRTEDLPGDMKESSE